MDALTGIGRMRRGVPGAPIALGAVLAAVSLLAPGCGGTGGGGVGGGNSPVISQVTANPGAVPPGGTIQLHVAASDPNGDALTYVWYVPSGAGEFPSGSTAATVLWTAPDSTIFDLPIQVSVSDGAHHVPGTVTVDVRADAPVISVSPDALTFGAGGIDTLTSGSPPVTDSLRFAVANHGGSALHWNVESDSSWLNLTPPGGVTTSGQLDSVLVIVNRAAIGGGTSGWRGAGITVSSDGGDVLLPVAVWVLAGGSPSP